MKYLFIFLLLIQCHATFSQTLQFQPLENKVTFDECLALSPPTFDHNYKNLYYSHYRFYNIFDYLNSATIVALNDSVFFEITKMNLETGIKQKYIQKKDVDTCNLIFSGYNSYVDSVNNDFIYINSTNNDSDFSLSTSNFNPLHSQRSIVIIDSNMNLKRKQKLDNNLQGVCSHNFLIENDSTLLCTNYYLPNVKNGIFRYNYLNGTLKDSFYFTNPSLNLASIHPVNDSTHVIISDSFAIYIDKHLNFKSKKYINYAGPHLLNNVPNYDSENTYYKYNKEDTTLYYITRNMYPFVINRRSQFDMLNLSKGTFNVNFQVNHDSVYNVNASNSKDINLSIKNMDFIYSNYKYGVSSIGQSNFDVNTVAIMNFDSMNNLRWKKYIGFDAYYENAMILATPDSGCLVIVNRLDVLNNAEKYDLYYIKLDKYGNQEKNYLPVSVSTFPDVAKTDLVVYPNPFTETIRFKSEKQQLFQLTIYDVSGKKMIAKTIETNQSISINNLPIGTYFYTLSVENKIIKGGVIEKISN